MALVGIDLGTSSVKVVVLDPDRGRVVASSRRRYELRHPLPFRAEQDPDDWLAATREAVREAVERAGLPPSRYEALGFSGQMHTLVLCRRDGRPVGPAITWADGRSAAEAREFGERLGPALQAELCNPPVVGFTGPSLLWVRRHEPERLASADLVCLPKDFLRHHLTGRWATDETDASATLLFDVVHRRWHPEACELVGVGQGKLPEVLPSTGLAGRLLAEPAQAMGLSEGLPVVAGAGDTACAAVGCGLVEPGSAMVTAGTGGQVYCVTAEPRVDRPRLRLHTLCHAVGGHWALMGATLTGASALDWWFRVAAELSGSGSPPGAGVWPVGPGRMDDEVAAVPAGSAGVLFLPYLSGERTPHLDPHAAGAFVGLRLHHTGWHLVRAVMEGVSLSLRDALELVEEVSGHRFARLRTGAGASRSATWRKIQASVLGRPLGLMGQAEQAATGAALLAGLGTGRWSVAELAGAAWLQPVEWVEPDPDWQRVYDEAMARFRSLYPSLRSCLS